MSKWDIEQNIRQVEAELENIKSRINNRNPDMDDNTLDRWETERDNLEYRLRDLKSKL